MKKHLFAFCLIFSTYITFGQTAPRWIDIQFRNTEYPESQYITGFVYDNLRSDENLENASERIRKSAQAMLSESIRINIESQTKSNVKSLIINDGSEQITDLFEKAVQTTANIEVTGLKVESYIDNNQKIVYALAYTNKSDLIKYYELQVTLNIEQVEGALRTAMRLERNGAKVKARKECEQTIPLLVKIEQAQDILTALDRNVSQQTLQQQRSTELYGNLVESLTRLEQNTYLFIDSKENIFGNQSTIINNQLKSMLALSGCSFTDDESQADFSLTLNAKTRKHGNENAGIVFCYADIIIELINNYTQKCIYKDEFAQKGGALNFENAGQKAFEDAVGVIVEKIKPWIEN